MRFIEIFGLARLSAKLGLGTRRLSQSPAP